MKLKRNETNYKNGAFACPVTRNLFSESCNLVIMKLVHNFR